jgi:hypothetical protein
VGNKQLPDAFNSPPGQPVEKLAATGAGAARAAHRADTRRSRAHPAVAGARTCRRRNDSARNTLSTRNVR